MCISCSVPAGGSSDSPREQWDTEAVLHFLHAAAGREDVAFTVRTPGAPGLSFFYSVINFSFDQSWMLD